MAPRESIEVIIIEGIEVTQPAARPQDTKPFPFVAETALSQGVCGDFHSTQSSWIWGGGYLRTGSALSFQSLVAGSFL